MTLTLSLAGCGQNNNSMISGVNEIISESTNSDTSVSETSIDLTNMFSDKDKDYSYEEKDCKIIELSDYDGDVKITSEGSYILRGTLTNASVIVEATKNDKIKLILDNANIESVNSAAIYVKKADKVFVTTTKDSVNTLKTTGEFEADGDTNIDAVIFSKSDITFNGQGKIVVATEYGNGITSKDDLVITSGSYDITASKHGLEGKKSVRIADGNVIISCLKDGIHSGKEDSEDGYTYIEGGDIEISAGDDGIHAEAQVIINGGNINILRSNEGVEGLSIEVLAGNVDVEATDDGFNATNGSSEEFRPGNREGLFSRSETEKGDKKDFENMQPPQDGERPQMPENGERPQMPENGERPQIPENGERPQMPEDGERPQMPENGWQPDNTQRPEMGEGPDFAGENNSSSDVYIKISGGKVDIKASGDGIDSNGSLYITGGEVYVTSTANTANGALDFNNEGIVSGGIVIAAGYSSMPQNFTSGSTQGAIMVNTNKKQSAGTIISLTDSNGKELISYEAQHEYNNVVISCPGIELNGVYTLYTGDESQKITMDNIIYGESNGFGPMGGKGGFGGDFRGNHDDGNGFEKKKRKNIE